MLVRLDPPIPVNTPKGEALCHGWRDYGIDFDLQWICFIEETGECWTFRNQDIRSTKNITMGRTNISNLVAECKRMSTTMPKQPTGEPYDWCAGKTVTMSEENPEIKEDYEWKTGAKVDPLIPWNSWSHYLPDEGRFGFITYRSKTIFLGIRQTNHLKVIEIKLDARYRIEEHGMIEGWKPYYE